VNCELRLVIEQFSANCLQISRDPSAKGRPQDDKDQWEKRMRRVAILILMLGLASWGQDGTQQTPPAQATAQPKTTTAKKSATAAKKATSSTTQKTGKSAAKKPTTSATKKTGTAGGASSAGVTAAKPGETKAAVPAANPEAIFETSMGKMKCELFPKYAPKTVANFIALAQGTKEWTDPKTGKPTKRPLFDGTIFHRVIPNFMIQGGDPIGNGTGGPGYNFEDEVTPELIFDKPGRLAMANSGPHTNTNGSQFFITEVPTPHLNGIHTIFGQCDDASVDLVKQIARVAADPRNNKPDLDVTLAHVEILGGPKKAVVAKKPTVTKRVIPKKPASSTAPKSN
jgi:peptidyl-prolyl cis-trans isomerase A (cyclophilin A)